MIPSPNWSHVKVVTTIIVIALKFTVLAHAGDECHFLVSGDVLKTISGVDDSLSRLVERVMPHLDEEVQIAVIQSGASVEIPYGTSIQLRATFEKWLKQSTEVNAHRVLEAASPLIKSAMMPYIHRIQSGTQWQEIIHQMNLELLEHMELVREEFVTEGSISHPGPFHSHESPKPWFSRRVRIYLYQGGGSIFGLSFQGLAVNEIKDGGGGPLHEQILVDGYSLQEVASMANDRGIRFEEMLGLITSLLIVNNSFDIPEVLNRSNAESSFENEELSRILSQKLTLLTPREERIVRLRYGLYPDGKKMTLGEVGELLGLTSERIRVIQERALAKLRHPTKGRQLRMYFDPK